MQSSNIKNSLVICLGEALIDRLGPLGGDPRRDHPVQDCLGGAPANVACGLAMLGAEVAFVGRLGTDEIGRSFQKLMQSRKINLLGLQQDPIRPSRIVLVRRDLLGERIFEGFWGDEGNGFADQAIELNELMDSWERLAKKALWLVCGTLPLANRASSEALLWAIKQAKESGINIAIDVNWRPTFWDKQSKSDSGPDPVALNKIQPLLENAALIKVSNEEAQWFFETSDPESISKKLPQQPDVVVTDGSKPIGFYLYGLSGSFDPLMPSKVIDTTGAGDAFMAGLVYQLLNNLNKPKDFNLVQEIVKFAAASGAIVCSDAGAIEPQPTKNQVDQFLDSY